MNFLRESWSNVQLILGMIQLILNPGFFKKDLTTVLISNCNKFYCNLTFYKLNTYLILTSACLFCGAKHIDRQEFFKEIFLSR